LKFVIKKEDIEQLLQPDISFGMICAVAYGSLRTNHAKPFGHGKAG
jgi:hypothetical protein